MLHYCGHPDRPGEPTLCGLSREPDGAPADAARATTTQGPDVTCPACLAALAGTS